MPSQLERRITSHLQQDPASVAPNFSVQIRTAKQDLQGKNFVSKETPVPNILLLFYPKSQVSRNTFILLKKL